MGPGTRAFSLCLAILYCTACAALAPACSSANANLDAWIIARLKLLPSRPLLPAASEYTDFLPELKNELEASTLPGRAIDVLFTDSAVYPTCAGHWLEFGVWNASTINAAADWRAANCEASCPWCMGFDTFQGLPEAWTRSPGDDYAAGKFSLDGKLPKVRENVWLWPGLFNDTLPVVLNLTRAMGTGDFNVSFLHIDCDLYQGAKEALQLLTDHIQVGTIIVFDDLVNYGAYYQGELRALWEWLDTTGIKVAALGIRAPLDGSPEAMHLVSTTPRDWTTQSASFVVMEKPPQQHGKPWAALTAAQLEAVPGRLQDYLTQQQQIENISSSGAVPSLQKGFSLFKRHHRP